MAQYEHLPIYKKSMDLAVFVETAVKVFSRYHKYTIRADLRNLSRSLVRLIIVANSREHKLEAFKSFTAFQTAAEAVNLGKQSEGWLRSTSRHSGLDPESRGPRKPPGFPITPSGMTGTCAAASTVMGKEVSR